MADHAFWRKAVAALPRESVNPVVDAGFRIGKGDKVVTAGSCFAQHISRHLVRHGFNFLVTESAHPLVSDRAEQYGYGVYSARYGNIYSSRQLLQLFERAFGTFVPHEDVWEKDRRFLDAFRPAIQPGGFASVEELQADRLQHFAAVRRAFAEMDYFIFTLGLTECWRSRADGAVYPLCPGVLGGDFDDANHEFLNLDVGSVLADMEGFIQGVRAINPAVKVVLTVSPVPLVATATGAHVLSATTLGKSILRVAADMLCSRLPDVFYFPAYEIVTGPQARGLYFADDLRSVTERGVERVMSVFLDSCTHGFDGSMPAAGVDEDREGRRFIAEMTDVVETVCEEEILDSGIR
ncbi:MAG TPA: GSCFA domain-containing protein [Lysobacter sp.]